MTVELRRGSPADAFWPGKDNEEGRHYLYFLKGRQLVFAARIADQPYEEAQKFYLGNRYILASTVDRHRRIRHLAELGHVPGLQSLGRPDNFHALVKYMKTDTAVEDKIRAEVLRKLALDIQVAEHFDNLGILPQLKKLEAEELERFERGEHVPIINPKLKELIQKTSLKRQ